MLVRKAIGWEQARPYVEPVKRRKKKIASQAFILDMTPHMKELTKTVFLGSVLTVMGLYLFGYSVDLQVTNRNMQNQIVIENRVFAENNLFIGELKSPTRIQKIAQDKLGMVLPDSFVYTSKNTVEERKLNVKKDIRE